MLLFWRNKRVLLQEVFSKLNLLGFNMVEKSKYDIVYKLFGMSVFHISYNLIPNEYAWDCELNLEKMDKMFKLFGINLELFGINLEKFG